MHLKTIAAALLLAAGGALTLPALAQPGPMGMGPGGMMHGAGHPGQGMDRMLEQVGATADQRAQIKQIAQAAEADLKAQHDAGRTLHQQLQTAFAQPTIDARAVESLRAQISAQHDATSKRMTQAMLDASNVLTADQRKTLSDLMSKRQALMQRHAAERAALDKAVTK